MFYRYKLFADIAHVIDLFKDRLLHIHINGLLNCDLKNAFIKVSRLLIPIYGASLASAFDFRDVFSQISSI